MKMNHSFTPSGVEHQSVLKQTSGILEMNHSFTPSGVEHNSIRRIVAAANTMNHSFTPSGVEHELTFNYLSKNQNESFVYAVRR